MINKESWKWLRYSVVSGVGVPQWPVNQGLHHCSLLLGASCVVCLQKALLLLPYGLKLCSVFPEHNHMSVLPTFNLYSSNTPQLMLQWKLLESRNEYESASMNSSKWVPQVGTGPLIWHHNVLKPALGYTLWCYAYASLSFIYCWPNWECHTPEVSRYQLIRKTTLQKQLLPRTSVIPPLSWSIPHGLLISIVMSETGFYFWLLKSRINVRNETSFMKLAIFKIRGLTKTF